jgi:Domain of unknown function (DUF4331)
MKRKTLLTIATTVLAVPALGFASSHREAPNIAGLPRVDGTDLYVFRSYESGRSGYVTLIANYIPLQDAYGGPNFFNLDTSAIYSININNSGDANADLSFQFRFQDVTKNLSVSTGGQQIAIPLINIGPVDASGKNLNVQQRYTLTVSRRSNGSQQLAENTTLGGTTFYRPADNIGHKSIADYAGYAAHFVYDVAIPGCSTPGRVFVGQRKEGFVVNLGEIFDLVNTNPVGPRNGEPNALADKNVTSLALEVPTACLTSGKDPVIGAWTTASLPRSSNSSGNDQNDANQSNYVQVSRLGNPLINEIIIGLPDKDKFNASEPRNDAQFLKYVTSPSFPVILNLLFGNAAVVPGTPRNDLVTAFLTGVPKLNQPANVRPAELLRLNTSTAPTPPANQNDLGVLGGDLAGFPNGRRPFDDVVDIELRVAEGALCGKIGNCGSQTSDPNGGKPYTDGARAAGPDQGSSQVSGKISATDTYLDEFPYLNTPFPGSPNGANGIAD